MTDTTPQAMTDALSALLPQGKALSDVLDAQSVQQLQTSWHGLLQLGFDLTVQANAIEVRHRDTRYETVIHLSRREDLGELRGLFVSLRSRFGRLRDRWLPWLFLPSGAVTAPYNHLRQLTETCQVLRQARPAHS